MFITLDKNVLFQSEMNLTDSPFSWTWKFIPIVTVRNACGRLFIKPHKIPHNGEAIIRGTQKFPEWLNLFKRVVQF
jgi:hypothetical protein